MATFGEGTMQLGQIMSLAFLIQLHTTVILVHQQSVWPVSTAV